MKVFLLAAVAIMMFAVTGFAGSTDVTDALVGQQTVVVAEHIDYPVWRYTGDSTVKRYDLMSIRFLWRRQGGTPVVEDTIMKWRPITVGVTADSVKPFLKFNTVK